MRWLMHLLALGLLFPSVALAAPGETAERELSSDVLPKAPHEQSRKFSLAQRALGEQRYHDALVELQSILAGAEDGFLAPREGEATQTTVRREVSRLLGSLPAKGREMYELEFGAAARALLDQAIAAGDQEALAQVGSSYLHTQAGGEAAMLLARDALDRGRPYDAISWLHRLDWSRAASGTSEPDRSLLLAACWLMAGSRDRARQSLDDLGRRLPGTPFHVGDRNFLASADNADALEALSKALAPEQRGDASSADCWPLFRGDPARNAASVWAGPLGELRWELKTVENRSDLDALQSLRQSAISRTQPLLPSMHPLIQDSTVILRTLQKVVALDGETGRRNWEYPWQREPERAPPNQRLSNISLMTLDRPTELRQRLSTDALYGQLSCDAQRVYFLDGLSPAPEGPRAQAMLAAGVMAFNARGGRDGQADPNCRLVALDLKREGMLAWVVGGESGNDEPRLAGAMFHSAPLVEGRRLYIPAEIQGEIQLCALAADSGRLEWSLPIARPKGSLLQDGLRRLSGAPPSLAEGVLVCPTSAGAIVAVDPANRSLLWGYAYQRRESLTRRVRNGPINVARISNNVESRWLDASVTVASGRVLVTPVDSDEIYCLDLLTGQEFWSESRDESLYLACVHEGKVVLVGNRDVTALRLADRKPAWPAPIALPADDLPNGRGLYAGRYYYLPTTARQIVQIDLDEGRLAGTLPTESVPGNLVGLRGRLISQSLDLVQEFAPAGQ